ncbi:hypothetical protein MY4824_002843 [Beauveria thailandica]
MSWLDRNLEGAPQTDDFCFPRKFDEEFVRKSNYAELEAAEHFSIN